LFVTHRFHTPSLATLTKFLICPKAMISLSPYTCCYKCLRVSMQTKNLSSFTPLRPAHRNGSLLQHTLYVCICSVTVKCNCIPGKVRIRKSARKNVFSSVSPFAGLFFLTAIAVVLSPFCNLMCSVSQGMPHALRSPVHAAHVLLFVIRFNSLSLSLYISHLSFSSSFSSPL